ncbi:MAG TPA: Imm39 family immunity protein [Alphaproteobacteria bacterium]|nr:Imm39 family immunity protein [Alphaproteobacteria bacterium]HQS94748.1 Imm39 family immunity protein [Alphaproteobacteria bacterium]
MHDPFDRRINFLGIALIIGKLINTNKIWKEIISLLDQLLRQNDIFGKAPFLYVQLAFLYGIKNDLNVEFNRIGKKYGDLGVAIEFDMEILKWADQNNLQLLHDIFLIGALEVLLQVCKKYNLPDDLIIKERLKYDNIPNTIAECETYKKS